MRHAIPEGAHAPILAPRLPRQTTSYRLPRQALADRHSACALVVVLSVSLTDDGKRRRNGCDDVLRNARLDFKHCVFAQIAIVIFSPDDRAIRPPHQSARQS